MYFKDRFGNHKKSFNHVKHKNDTELSKEFWEVKKREGTPKITCKIIAIYYSYKPNSRRCFLCLHEKFKTAAHTGDKLLNERAEIISTSRKKEQVQTCQLWNYRLMSALRYHYNASFWTVMSYFIKWRLITWKFKF